MATEAEWVTNWQESELHDQRARLNELGANENRNEDEENEHNALATLVATNEDELVREAADGI